MYFPCFDDFRSKRCIENAVIRFQEWSAQSKLALSVLQARSSESWARRFVSGFEASIQNNAPFVPDYRDCNLE